MKLCEACEKDGIEFSYRAGERRVFICEGCLRKVAGDCEWGDYICPVTGKTFTSESICIERKEEGNAEDSRPKPKHSSN